MVNFGEAIKRPFQDFKKLGIGALMYMIPLVNIITGFFSSGYGLECAKTGMKKKYELPKWADWGNLWVKGFLCFLIGAIYCIPLAIIFVITLGATLFGSLLMLFFEANPQAFMSGFGTISSSLIWFFLVGLLTIYIIPMAIMFFVDKGKFSDAFKLGMVLKKAFTSEYLAAWIIVMIYSFVVGVVASLLSAITTITVILPLIIMGFANMILVITSMTVFGEVYSEIK